MDTHEQNKDLSRKVWELADRLRAEIDLNSYKEHLIQLLVLKSTPQSNNSN